MRGPVLLCALAVAGGLAATAASATTCNIDFIAAPPQTAYDIELVLSTNQGIVNANYNGTPGSGDDVFSAFDVSYGSTNTLLHWSMPQSPIVIGTHLHVGWTTSDNSCPPCITGFYTNQAGRQIGASNFSLAVTDHLTNFTGTIDNLCLIPLDITNIRGACLAAPVPLAALNSSNSSLVAQLQPLSSGGSVPPNGQLTFPLPPGSSCHYVFNYTIVGQPTAQISPWVEMP
jgi:hypothetical protein